MSNLFKPFLKKTLSSLHLYMSVKKQLDTCVGLFLGFLISSFAVCVQKFCLATLTLFFGYRDQALEDFFFFTISFGVFDSKSRVYTVKENYYCIVPQVPIWSPPLYLSEAFPVSVLYDF